MRGSCFQTLGGLAVVTAMTGRVTTQPQAAGCGTVPQARFLGDANRFALCSVGLHN